MNRKRDSYIVSSTLALVIVCVLGKKTLRILLRLGNLNKEVWILDIIRKLTENIQPDINSKNGQVNQQAVALVEHCFHCTDINSWHL